MTSVIWSGLHTQDYVSLVTGKDRRGLEELDSLFDELDELDEMI